VDELTGFDALDDEPLPDRVALDKRGFDQAWEGYAAKAKSRGESAA